MVFNKSNFEIMAKEYLAHPESYLNIREKGKQLIKERHALSKRLDFLQKHLQTAQSQKKAMKESNKKAKQIFLHKNDQSFKMNLQKIKTLPKILFIVDSPHWAHDFKTDNLIKNLSDNYEIIKCYQSDVKVENIEWADLIVVYYWKQFHDPNMQKLLNVFQENKNKLLLGICSHNELEGDYRQQGTALLKSLASGIFVNNMFLYREFLPVFDVPVFYTPNGVDTDYFTYDRKNTVSGTLRVGWAGSLYNHRNKRGFHNFIVPVIKAVDNIELVTAIREQEWLDKQQMLEFYRSLDLYICASLAEGTPNPCLEAASCGVPLITTRVGNMPELIKHGVNGFFVEHNINDIAKKLIILKNNVPLRQYMSESILRSIKEWDWGYRAENYRVMFDTILSQQKEGENNLFKSKSQIYLASADRMDRVIGNVNALKSLASRSIDTYATVIGGLSGLNYLLSVEPKNIKFFDINPEAIKYAKLIVEIISISKNPRDFISRIFSRSVDSFLNQCGFKELTCENQDAFLKRPIETEIYSETITSLSEHGGSSYREFIEPFLSGKIFDEIRNCCCLLPCWKTNERVPVGGGQKRGYDENGHLVPNTNTFFYGQGWLGSEEYFLRIKEILKKAELNYIHFDLLNNDLKCLGDFSDSLVLHASNIDDWFPDQWVRTVNSLVRHSLEKQGYLAVITTNGGVITPEIEPHIRALTAIKPFIYGNVVEVTSKVPWGFHEFDRNNVYYKDYLKDDYKADTTILHILIGEGVNRNIFKDIYEKAIKNSNRVVVIEHNYWSNDWKDEEKRDYVSVDSLKQILNEINEKYQVCFIDIKKIPGETDLERNILFVIDNEFTASLYKIEETNTNDYIVSDRTSNAPYGLPAKYSVPKLSVVLTTCNRHKLLEETLAGFADQTTNKEDYEVIVVDDGSNPKSEEIVGKFSSSMKVKYIWQENSGLSTARNNGIKAAIGQIVLFSDDDDVPSPELISEHILSHEKNPDPDIVVLGHLDWHRDLEMTPLMYYISHVGGEYFCYNKMEHGKFYEAWKWWGGLVSAKMSLLKSLNGPFDKRLRFGYEDTELVCRLKSKSVKVLYNANAKSYILRSIDFKDFCMRRYMQGQALYYVACTHPEIIVPRYKLRDAASEYYNRYASFLDDWSNKIIKFEKMMNEYPHQHNSEKSKYLESLYNVYGECFRGFLLKGYVEQLELSQKSAVSQDKKEKYEEEKEQKKITFISNVLPVFDRTSSNLRIYEILHILKNSGYKIDYLYFEEAEGGDKYKNAFSGSVNFIKLYPSIDNVIKYFDLYAKHESNYVWITNIWNTDYGEFALALVKWLKTSHPAIQTIVDTMDFHYKKFMRKFDVSHDDADLLKANQFLEIEKKLYPLAHKVLTVTDVEKLNILENIGDFKNVSVIPNVHSVLPNTPDFQQRKNICFLGALHINHNIDAVRWFIKNVFPLISQNSPGIQFHIMGFNNERYKNEFETNPNVKVIGYVQEAEIAVSNYRVFVCPMIYGAGMKGKLGVAAAAGTPIVTTQTGAEGFNFVDGRNCFIADDPLQFAQRCLYLFNDSKIWEQFRRNAATMVDENFSIEAVSSKLKDLLEGNQEVISNLNINNSQKVNIEPKVSIIIACHNCEIYLEKCIESIRNQTMQDWELFLLDDASSDDTKNIIEIFSQNDKRIKAYYFEEIKGPYVRRNFAIERTNSEFIVIQDSDDIMHPQKLEKLYNEIKNNDMLCIVGSFYLMAMDEFRDIRLCDKIDLPVTHQQIMENYNKHLYVCWHGSAIIRKSLFENIGLYDEHPYGSDKFWLAKAAEYARLTNRIEFKNIPEYLTYKIEHSSSQQGQFPNLDPRSRRAKFQTYWLYLLMKIREKVLAQPGTDICSELKNCKCSDYIAKYGHLFEEWEKQKIDDESIGIYILRAVERFNEGNYVTSIIMLDSIEKMKSDVSKRMQNYNFLRDELFCN